MRLHRAQARDPRLADLRDGVRRRRRLPRLADRGRDGGHAGDVHDDEQCPPQRRPSGRLDRRARDPGGGRLRPPAGPGRPRGAAGGDRRSSRCPAYAPEDDGADPGGPGALLLCGGADRPRHPGRRGCAGSGGPADAPRQGLRDRRRLPGGEPRRAGPWRHGASSRRPARPSITAMSGSPRSTRDERDPGGGPRRKEARAAGRGDSEAAARRGAQGLRRAASEADGCGRRRCATAERNGTPRTGWPGLIRS
jgi:hypothetical protein